MDLSKPFLGLCAAGFILIGINTFIDPLAAMAPVELDVNRPNALNELHATYGGMQIGIGLLLIAGIRTAALLRPALLALAFIVGGLATGRVISIVVDGVPDAFMLSLLAVETTLTVVSLVFWFRRPEAA